MTRVTASCFVLLVLLIGTTVYSQNAKTPFAPVPMGQRLALTKRLIAYTSAFRKKDWASLYDLVSDQNKFDFNHKLKVNRHTFIRDMQGTYNLQRLIKFAPVRTDNNGSGNFDIYYDIYGCGELPYGNEKIERIAAVRAVREHGDWFFTNWDYPDPPEPCSHLSDPAWKARNLRLGEPMSQIACELNTCTL